MLYSRLLGGRWLFSFAIVGLLPLNYASRAVRQHPVYSTTGSDGIAESCVLFILNFATRYTFTSFYSFTALMLLGTLSRSGKECASQGVNLFTDFHGLAPSVLHSIRSFHSQLLVIHHPIAHSKMRYKLV